ncbi:MAG: hypothetical protein JSR34_03470 [Proteobacteria bacterium]|nr:hypothetical protein [Pseudomonadota bacterium]
MLQASTGGACREASLRASKGLGRRWRVPWLAWLALFAMLFQVAWADDGFQPLVFWNAIDWNQVNGDWLWVRYPDGNTVIGARFIAIEPQCPGGNVGFGTSELFLADFC